MSNIRDLALASTAWPFEEARKLLKRYEKAPPAKGYVLFETGYGPSGLPHIGTFGEVARTTMVRKAFELISDIPTKLIAFSDDMDGLRKVPDTIPNKADYERYTAQKPKAEGEQDMIGGVRLTAIPDPFGTHDNFGAHMNARLRAFLDSYGFDYEFKSATDCYFSGEFDETLLKVAAKHEAICNVVKPAISEGRREHYSPFLPIDTESQRPLQVDVKIVDAAKGIIGYHNPLSQNAWVEQSILKGGCKLQWRADWGMRWVALGVDYEMYGKDLIPSAELSYEICKVIGGTPPDGFFYELFLDEKGGKISKSKGNGLTIDEWLRYGIPESLSYYMYQSPRKAKRLHFDVIPQHVDEYQQQLEKFVAEEPAKQLNNPVFHIHNGKPPKPEVAALRFGLLLNLASVCNPDDKSVLWGFISRYAPDATPATCPTLDKLAGFAVTYYNDFVKPAKKYRSPTELERTALHELQQYLEGVNDDTSGDDIQTAIFEIGKRHPFPELRAWFQAMYETLLGQPSGPRMGSFIALYGRKETLVLLKRVLAGEMAAA